MFTTTYAADSPWNDAHWKNKRFNTLLVEARTELDPDRRRAMYWELQEIVRDDGGTIIPVYGNMSLPAAATWPMALWPQTETSMAGSRWNAGGLSHLE